MQARHITLLSLLLVQAAWQHPAEARKVAAAPGDMVTDPQAVVAVDPQLAVADQAVLSAPVLLAPGQADVPGLQLEPSDAGAFVTGMKPGPITGNPPGAGAGASTFCGARDSATPPGACGDVTVKGTTLQCDVGGATGTNIVYSSQDGRFVKTDFALTCLVDAALACDASKNSVTVNGQVAGGCCSCFLYNQFYNPDPHNQFTLFRGASNTLYVSNKPNLSPGTAKTSVWHLLVMPFLPCTGVENWFKVNTAESQCPQEDIWNAAFFVIARDIQPIFMPEWGAAVNPVERRGQHQLHLHVAAVYRSLLSSVAYAVHADNQRTYFELNCGTLSAGATRLKQCTYDPSSGGGDNVQVHIQTGSTPDQAKPFEKVYSKNPDNTKNNKAALKASTLVLRVPFTTNFWAVIVNFKGPAECFFEPNGDCDLAKACFNSHNPSKAECQLFLDACGKKGPGC